MEVLDHRMRRRLGVHRRGASVVAAAVRVALSVGVQHHPARVLLLPNLIRQLDPLHTEIVTDPDPEGRRSSWRTFRLALETTPVGATHRIVVQDDAVPCEKFPKRLKRLVAERHREILVLCVCGDPPDTAERMRKAAETGERWVQIRGPHIPTVATVWPVGLIRPFLAWVDNQGWGEHAYNTNDDWIAGTWLQETDRNAYTCVPSIVEHPDVVPSLLKNHVGGRTAAVI